MLSNLFARLRVAVTPQAPPPEVLLPPAPGFSDVVPETYADTRTRYPFLPAPSEAREEVWRTISPYARAVFVLDYVASVYAGVGVAVAQRETQGLPSAPTVVLRTPDHPQASTRPAGEAQGTESYAVWFDTDMGTRVEVHMGPVIFASFRTLARDWPMAGRRAS